MTTHQQTTDVISAGAPPAAVPFDRRVLLRRGAALGAALAGAGVLTRFGPASAQDATPAGSPAAASANPEIVAAANAFLETLSDSEREAVLFDFSDTEQKQRWSNLPEGLFERAGLMWGNLSEQSRAAWLGLMQITLSTEGYDRILAEWYADDALAAEGGGAGGGPGAGPDDDDDGTPDDGTPGGGPPGGGQLLFGSQYYWVALIGEPSETDPWQWQWGGHHVQVNATFVGPDLALTPSFIGSQPTSYTDADGNTVTPLGDIEADAFALVNLLDPEQQQAAVLGDEPIDVVLGPGQDGRTIQPEGLPAAEMSADQRAALLQLIGRYAGLANDAAATARLTEIEATLDETYLAWYGPTEEGTAAYFRVTGPTLVIEYSPQQMGGDATDHIHGIYRDPTNDYGARSTGITIGS